MDASEEDVRAAYRRRAKELHPDARQGGRQGDGGEAFIWLKRAYDTLSDPAARRAYDSDAGLRRGLGFFRDVDPAAGGAWGAGGAAPGGRAGGGANPWDAHRALWEQEEARARAAARRAGEAARRFSDGDPDDDGGRGAGEGSGGAGGGGGGGGGGGPPVDPAEFLEHLSRAMSGPGGLAAFQSGRLDPFGTSSSDTWFRRVEEQRSTPFGGRPAGGWGRGLDRSGGSEGEYGAPPEWGPHRRQGGGDEGSAYDGWRPEWRRPGRGGGGDADDGCDGRGDEGGRAGGRSRPLKGDDFRRGGGGGGGGWGLRGW